jgi:hypothetical protein
MKKQYLLFFGLLFGLVQAEAQQNHILGTWNILNGKLKINERWSLFAEGQIRSLSIYNQFHYYEIKGGVDYKLGKYFILTAGGGSYNTFTEGGNFKTPIQQEEIRLWQQLVMKQDLTRLFFEHRYRAEQRFRNNGYRNRFRYRIALNIPLNRQKIEPGAFYLSAWNEIFFTDRPPYFERNRVLIGGGYSVNTLLNVQLGYLHQLDYRINDETGRDFIQIGLNFSFELPKKAVKD